MATRHDAKAECNGEIVYDVWVCRADVPSEWDGGGSVVESHLSRKDAEDAVKRYQEGGDAAWIEEQH